MFVLRDEWTFPVRVNVTTPSGEEQSFEVVCRTGPMITERLADPAQAEEALAEAAVDWRHVVDQEGKTVPFDRTLFRQLLREEWFALPFLEAYVRARRATRGNSCAPSDVASPGAGGRAN